MSVAPEILRVYSECDRIAKLGLPYALGGGHNPSFAPSEDIRPGYTQVGYDCSGAVSRALHVAGILGSPAPLSTAGLIDWGLADIGEWMGLHVIDSVELAHCFLEFRIPGRHRWWAARHTGTIVGWTPYADPTGYRHRRRKP